MTRSDFQEKFQKSVDDFLAPVLEKSEGRISSCQVFWVHPREPEHDNDFPLEIGDAEHYARSFIGEGFFSLVRFISNTQQEVQLQLVFWEEWDGEFVKTHRPPHEGTLIDEWVWKGCKL